MGGHDIKKTNAMRLLDQAHIVYKYYEYYDDYDLWDAYCNYLSQWFAENYPVNDEHGNPIDPWYVN